MINIYFLPDINPSKIIQNKKWSYVSSYQRSCRRCGEFVPRMILQSPQVSILANVYCKITCTVHFDNLTLNQAKKTQTPKNNTKKQTNKQTNQNKQNKQTNKQYKQTKQTNKTEQQYLRKKQNQTNNNNDADDNNNNNNSNNFRNMQKFF